MLKQYFSTQKAWEYDNDRNSTCVLFTTHWLCLKEPPAIFPSVNEQGSFANISNLDVQHMFDLSKCHEKV